MTHPDQEWPAVDNAKPIRETIVASDPVALRITDNQILWDIRFSVIHRAVAIAKQGPQPRFLFIRKVLAAVSLEPNPREGCIL